MHWRPIWISDGKDSRSRKGHQNDIECDFIDPHNPTLSQIIENVFNILYCVHFGCNISGFQVKSLH